MALSIIACRSSRSPVNVAVAFDNTWKLGSESVTDSEKALIKSTALETLRSAYEGFDIRFDEAPSGERVIRVEHAPYASGFSMVTFGATGTTYPASRLSSVRFDVLFNAELAAARCADIIHCQETRTELLEGLGRGIGATAAHELGHQAGFLGFALDSRCDDCYDGAKSTSYGHFFGRKHWSHDALEIMRRVLPPARRG